MPSAGRIMNFNLWERSLVFIVTLTVCVCFVCSRAEGPRMEWCGVESYNPNLQCCCGLTVNDLPKRDCQCCGTKAYRWNETKPRQCMRPCGTQQYHIHTQLCCNRVVVNATSDTHVCCGSQVIDTNSHVCCRLNASVALDQRNYKCCKGLNPYHLSTMRCDRKSGVTSLKGRQQFRSELLCQRHLPVFDVSWPPPAFHNKSYAHIRAIPESCKITVKEVGADGKRVTIPFSSFAIAGRHQDPDCLQTSGRMELVVRVRPGQPCASQGELQHYLEGQVLDLFVRKALVCAKRPVRPLLRLKDGQNAVIFMAGSAKAVMARSLQDS